MAGKLTSFAILIVLILFCGLSLSTMHGIMARPLSDGLGHGDFNKKDSVNLFLESSHKEVVKSSNNEKFFSPQIVLDNSGPSNGGAGH